MSIKLRAWDDGTDTMIYSKDYDDLQDFFYDVKRRENGGNLVSLMIAPNANNPIYEGDIIRFGYNDGVKTGIVECLPEHFCYWQVRIPGDHLGLLWVLNCCPNVTVTGNRHTDREWLEDHGFGALLDEAEPEIDRIDREHKAKMVDIEAGHRDRIEAIRETAEHKAALQKAVDQSLAMAADVKPISLIHFEPKADWDTALQNAVIEAMRPMIREKLEKEAAGPLFIQPGELPEIDPEKEKAADEAMAKLGFRLVNRVKVTAPKPARIESGYNDDFGRKIKEGDILSFKLCGRQLAGEVKHIWSDDRYYWQVWTYEPDMRLSLLHICEDVACTEVRVIGHISTVRQGGVAVQDIGIQL